MWVIWLAASRLAGAESHGTNYPREESTVEIKTHSTPSALGKARNIAPSTTDVIDICEVKIYCESTEANCKVEILLNILTHHVFVIVSSSNKILSICIVENNQCTRFKEFFFRSRAR